MSKSHNGAGRKPAPKRVIKSHKGGRTSRAPEARMTPEDLAALESLLEKLGLSFGDWLHEKIAADSQAA